VSAEPIDALGALSGPSGLSGPAIRLSYTFGEGSGSILVAETVARVFPAYGSHAIADRWLPDGERIVFVGAEPDHRPRYYVQDSLNSTPRPISGEGIVFSRGPDDIVLSPDGRRIAVAMTDGTLQLLHVDGSAGAAPIPIARGLTPIRFCRDNHLLAYRAGELPVHVVRIELAEGRQTPWKELGPADLTGVASLGAIRIAPDCETYAYSASRRLD
jgi:hypothetical protein